MSDKPTHSKAEAKPDVGKPAETPHPTGDRILSTLVRAKGLVGSLVAEFPGSKAAGDNKWLDDWFSTLALRIHKGEDVPESDSVAPEILAELSAQYDASCAMPFRIMSVDPHFFRGFRILAEPIRLDADLVVIEGRNSHGKTSVAEALEWLFTGALSRRESGAQGNARELESCVGNHFRPVGESTWVEVLLKLVAGESLLLRRVLTEDYGTTTTARCGSRLERDGLPLSLEEERALLDALLAGCPPLLMQHTLGQFIHSGPSTRRQYFERLLQLEELTDLIERAVLGTRVASIPTPTGGIGRLRWEALKSSLKVGASKSRVRAVEQAPPDEWQTKLPSELASIAALEFPSLVEKSASSETALSLVAAAQMAERQRTFPLLTHLRPKRTVDAAFQDHFSEEQIAARHAAITVSLDALAAAEVSAAAISEAERAIAQAVSLLEHAGLIPTKPSTAVECPVCAHAEIPTLTPTRIAQVRGWEPARAAVSDAKRQVASALDKMAAHAKSLAEARLDLIPKQPTEAKWDAAVNSAHPQIVAAATAFRSATLEMGKQLAPLDNVLLQLVTLAKDARTATIENLELAVSDTRALLGTVLVVGREYAAQLKTLEDAIGSQAIEGDDYIRRDRWLEAARDPSAIVNDFSWSRAVKRAQELLAGTRTHLMAARQELLERHRQELTDGFKEVWDTLRADRYSAFHALTIPAPSGKGYKVEIQVKAQLDDGVSKAQVDALRVFSESQVNVLGIAAFVTRAKLLGHRVLVFDDPVQSMDEDHFKTFAGRLLADLLAQGFQLIVLTHNDTFARDVSYAHANRESYATITISHARKTGCRVDLDNRRFSERMRRARKAVDDGDLSEGWKALRLAIERLYVVAYLKHGPQTFKPVSWIEQTAESMFNQGVGDVIEKVAPGFGSRAKEIVQMTAAGAHDKAACGETDFALACADLMSLRKNLSLVD